MADIKLHPGAKVAIAKLRWNELDIAKAMVAGQLTSPQPYENIVLFNIRISGTGTAYRSKLNEFVYRRPEHYLTERFLERAQGLPVVFYHPEKATLDTDTYRKSTIGSIFIPYIKDDEAWAIARVNDLDAARVMIEKRLSTSPGVLFHGTGLNQKLKLADGRHLLIEDDPTLLDHLAICEEGVWDKGGDPTGIESTPVDDKELLAMADDTGTTAHTDASAGQALTKTILDAIADARKDFNGGVSSLSTRMDAIEGRFKDDDDAKKDKAFRDRLDACASKDDDDDAKKDGYNDDAKFKDMRDAAEPEECKGMPKETEADKKKHDAGLSYYRQKRDELRKKRKDALKDSAANDDDDKKDAALKDRLDDDAKGRKDDNNEEPDELKKMTEGPKKDAMRAHWSARRDAYAQIRKDARADAVATIQADIKRVEALIPKALSDADYAALSSAQAKADAVYVAFGDAAPRPLQGEDLLAYRRRLAVGLQKRLPEGNKWKALNLTAQAEEVVGIAEEHIYTDAMAAALLPIDLGEGELREIKHKDVTGRVISNFVGEPRAWMSQFGTMNRQQVAGIRNVS